MCCCALLLRGPALAGLTNPAAEASSRQGLLCCHAVNALDKLLQLPYWLDMCEREPAAAVCKNCPQHERQPAYTMCLLLSQQVLR